MRPPAPRLAIPRPWLAPIWREIRPARSCLIGAGPPPALDVPESGGEPVLLIPGFLSGDASMRPLAAHLAACGHHPVYAGIRRNTDCSEATLRRLLVRLEAAASEHERPVVIVGHSRGGMLARVLAHRRPDLVSGVVSLAAPWRDQLAIHPLVLLQALALGLAGAAGVRGMLRFTCALGSCCGRFRDELTTPLPAGVAGVAIYTRSDGVVDWRACVDPAARSVEVATSHCGMISHPPTLQLVAQALSELCAV